MAAQSRGSARGPGDRPIRLDSLKNPQPRPLPRLKTRKVPDSCPNPECACTEIINEDSKNICKDCGTVISEDDMVTDVQYGLGSVGNHVIHGKHVGNDQAYNKEGDVFDRHRAMDSEELTNMRGKDSRHSLLYYGQLKVQRQKVYSRNRERFGHGDDFP